MSEFAANWGLDPAMTYLNHGSFGACPKNVLKRQAQLRDELESEPVKFFISLEEKIEASKARLAEFVGAAAADLAFVPNATTGVNAVLRSLKFEVGDEVLCTDHTYNACRNALDWVAERAGVKVNVTQLPFPNTTEQGVIDAIESAVTVRTRLALLDHITSPSALVLPIGEICRRLQGRGIDVLVDGAHAPGMIDLDIERIGAAYYTGNCHKWMCAPKGAAFLHVRRDRQDRVAPHVISHGQTSTRADRSRYQLAFDWLGTSDPSAAICVGTAIDVMAEMVEGGWREIRKRNRALCLAGRDLLIDALGLEPAAPDSMTGSMASLILPAGGDATIDGQSPLSAQLREQDIEVPIFHFPYPRQVLRISAQLYNSRTDFEKLAAALVDAVRRD